MRYTITIFIVLVSGCRAKDTSNRNNNGPNTTVVDEEKYDLGDTECSYHKTNKRLGDTYPFNKSDKIELVSYDTRQDSYSNDSLIRDGNFAVTNIQQRIHLNKTQTDSLFSILFDYKKIRQGNAESVADCYNPRHSVVFYQGGRAFAFLEVCFECNGTRHTPDLDFGEFCDEKWCSLQKFCRTAGADFGLINEMCE